MILRSVLRGLAVAAMLAAAGCATKDPAISQLGGSEPQRISFGDPKTVQANFSAKMNACWFGGAKPLLQGYKVDARPMTVSAEGAGGASSMLYIYPDRPGRTGREGFVVQFNAYNDNTLISTRNLSLPPDLAAKLRRDVETWVFGRQECGDADTQLPSPVWQSVPAPAKAQDA